MNDSYISVEEVAKVEGLTFDELLFEYAMESVVPACCSHGCQVEPDGHCEHGNPSILLDLCLL